MAEFVQQNIEGMIPELEQMERVGLFTGQESRLILKKRKSYEYKLQRKTKQKEDFLKYIQYETNVLKLLEKRRKKTGYTFKKLQIDGAISQRIHMLFRVATYRFQDDVKLWLSHIDFCKMRKEKNGVSKLFTRMLQVHNRKPDLWIMAAKWELEENIHPGNARSIFQRGLRFNSSCQKLWLEYYRMELLFAEKLRKRKGVLGSLGSDMLDTKEGSQDAVLEGAVALVVYKQGLETFPDDVRFILSFLPICRLFDFVQNHEEQIFSDVLKSFPDRPETFDAIARGHIYRASKLTDADQEDEEIQKCYAVFEEAVTKGAEGEIWSLYLSACLELVQTKSTKKIRKKRIHKLLEVFDEAVTKDAVTASLFETWLDVLTKVGLVREVVTVCELATQHHPKMAALWMRRLQAVILAGRPEDHVIGVFHQACKQVLKKKSLPLWQLILDYCITNQSVATVTLFEKAVCCHDDVSGPIKVLYLQWVYLSAGIVKARELYKRFMQPGLVPLLVIQEYIRMENVQATPKMKLLRQAYEEAVSEYGATNADLWIEYVKLELTHPDGRPEDAGNIHYRAVKCLEGELNQQFVTQYTLLQTGHMDI